MGSRRTNNSDKRQSSQSNSSQRNSGTLPPGGNLAHTKTRQPTVIKYGIDGEDDDDDAALMDGFSLQRVTVHNILYSGHFDAFIAALVFFNLILMIVETDERSRLGMEPATWLVLCNYLFLFIYSVEVSLRLYVKRLKFFTNIMNLIDITCVGTDVISEVILQSFGTDVPVLSIFRLMRLLRLARTLKVVLLFPHLALMVKSLFAAFSAIAWGVVLVFLFLTLWSVIAVQVIHPLNQEVSALGVHEGCDRCPRAFESVMASALTFCQQIITGDSWGLVSIPIIEHSPSSALFFIAVFVTVDLAIMNVILAVIVESAQKFGAEDSTILAREGEKKFAACSKKLMRMCAEVDADGSGLLHLDELVKGIQAHEEFRDELLAMDIKEEDLSIVFRILDSDESGDVSYEEFVNELYRMKNETSHTMLVFIKFYCVEINARVRDQIRMLEDDIISMFDKRNVAAEPKNTLTKDLSDGAAQMLIDSLHVALGSSTLTDELRQLRLAITEDLSRSMGDMARRYDNNNESLRGIAKTMSAAQELYREDSRGWVMLPSCAPTMGRGPRRVPSPGR